MELTNYKLIEFLNQPAELINEYLVALKYLKPIDTERKLMFMKLKHVELVKRTLSTGSNIDLIKIVSKVQKISKEDVLQIPIITFFKLIASIREQLKVILRAEENGLIPNYTDQKWIIVDGSKKMAKFEIYNTLENLSGGDVTKYNYINNMQYAEVFTILRMRKTLSDLRHEMSTIKSKKE